MASIRHLLYQFRTEIKRSRSLAIPSRPSFNPWSFFFRWKKDLSGGRNSVSEEMVWLTYPVIDFLKKNLNKEMKVFEYGGGGSTLFFAKRVGELITVEHDEQWFQRLSEILNEKKIAHWKGKFISPEATNIIGSAADPSLYLSSDENSKKLSFKNYATAIDEYPSAYFDLVLIDGRARPSCLYHSIPKVKKGGFLILDNSERKHYHELLDHLIDKEFEKVVDGMAPVPFGEWFSCTTVWRKKS